MGNISLRRLGKARRLNYLPTPIPGQSNLDLPISTGFYLEKHCAKHLVLIPEQENWQTLSQTGTFCFLADTSTLPQNTDCSVNISHSGTFICQLLPGTHAGLAGNSIFSTPTPLTIFLLMPPGSVSTLLPTEFGSQESLSKDINNFPTLLQHLLVSPSELS
jgi:hypothetical protein